MKTILLVAMLLANTAIFSQTHYIPTVVHILYFDAEEDMSSVEVEVLINHVNLGLRGLSDNQAVSREIFDVLWADTEIQLCLATVDEFGGPTDGIVHKKIGSRIEPGDFFRTKGESSPWDTDLYFNIWISSMGRGSETSGGIATTPTVPHSTFPNPHIGVMLNKDSYNPPQILIHEVGHFFGLKHLYRDDIDDTPCSNNAINPEPRCLPRFLTVNTCSDEAPIWNGVDPPDMIENYMEYYGNCAKMFTRGQKARMR
ncbi:MAG: M43 family zinc metalloprotease, partial [Bacteroidota bacterium]